MHRDCRRYTVLETRLEEEIESAKRRQIIQPAVNQNIGQVTFQSKQKISPNYCVSALELVTTRRASLGARLNQPTKQFVRHEIMLQPQPQLSLRQ